MNILEISKLSKEFGKNKILQDVNLSVPENCIFGFLGENGAGKTTTMKIILGLLKPTSGDVTVCKEKVTYGENKTNKYIGYLPDVPEFYGYMRPKEYLKLCGEITGLSTEKINKRSEELLKLVGLQDVNKKISGFSRGMKQRLGIAQALLNEPKLLICDEPTSALDPIGRKEILDILYKVKGKTTVIFSTHILSDVERICDNIAILHGGNIVLSGALSEIKSQYRNNSLIIEFESMDSKKKFMSSLKINSFIKNIEDGHTSIIFKGYNIEEVQSIMLQVLVEEKILPIKFEILEPTLENLFMEVIK